MANSFMNFYPFNHVFPLSEIALLIQILNRPGALPIYFVLKKWLFIADIEYEFYDSGL